MDSRKELFAALAASAAAELSRQGVLNRLHKRIAALRFASVEGTVEHFTQRAEENGATVLFCPTLQELPAMLLAQIEDAKRVCLSSDDLFDACGLAEALSASATNREITSVSDTCYSTEDEGWKREYAAVDVGIDRSVVGIADAGAVFIAASEKESRSVSLLSAHHVVVLAKDDIVASLHDAVPVIRTSAAADANSALTLVGGPSKTADIEKVLVTGVHGPRRFTIILLDSLTQK